MVEPDHNPAEQPGNCRTFHSIAARFHCPAIVKARHNAMLLNLNNVEFVNAGIERLPLPDESVDVAISNGVFNLCPDKPRILAEAYRVLRPGGRLQMADILLEEGVTPEEVAKKGSWSD
ncbi:MAG TPA: methyltransferase domain-containing protein [Gemmataceae bacterium]|nr:methyltransferase domain-containing protein [Gemmataceae bacterium]